MDSKNESKIPETVSYYDHQEQLAREERHTERWKKFAWALFAALILSNLGWLLYENSFQDVVVTENTQDGGGTNIIGGGDIQYESEKQDNQDKG